MSHAYHEGQANYNQYQLYFDGCTECKMRAERPDLMFAYIKDFPFAWGRAVRLEQGRLDPAELPLSEIEVPVLRAIYGLAVVFEKHGIPFGQFPGETARVLRELIDENKASILAVAIDGLIDPTET